MVISKSRRQEESFDLGLFRVEGAPRRNRMSGLKKIIKKAQALSADEIFVRSTQTLQSLRERRGLSVLSRLPSDEAFEALLYSSQLSKDFRLIKQGRFLQGAFLTASRPRVRCEKGGKVFRET
jgi:hypothetical protein